jgi:hypothetical protein
MSADNYKQMSEEAYDCIMQCFAAGDNAKWLTGIGSGGGCALVKKLYAAKGSIQHQIGKQDIVLERLALLLVAMRGWPEYRDKLREAAMNHEAIDSKPPAESYGGRSAGMPGSHRGAIHSGSASDSLPLMGVQNAAVGGPRTASDCLLKSKPFAIVLARGAAISFERSVRSRRSN